MSNQKRYNLPRESNCALKLSCRVLAVTPLSDSLVLVWNNQLASLATTYPTGVLSIVDQNGYPLSVRCTVQVNTDRQFFTISDPPAWAANWRGKACLLFHTHDKRLQGMRQMVVLGELVNEDGILTLQVIKFVTANGRQDSDEMPHAASPFHMLKFFWLGWRSARKYIARRGAPWPPIPFDEIRESHERK